MIYRNSKNKIIIINPKDFKSDKSYYIYCYYARLRRDPCDVDPSLIREEIEKTVNKLISHLIID